MLFSKVAALLVGCATALPSSPAIEPRQSATYTNPIVYEDLPDLDVFRVGDVFYYSSSTFAYSPGAPLYKSYDLVNWAPVTHSVPTLDFGDKYNLPNSSDRAYVKGIWASSVRYRESTDTFYWVGCIEFSKTYIYTSSGSGAGANNGEAGSWNWEQAAVIDTCYYDCGLFIDDDDTMYVVYGNTQISVAQLSSDGLSQVQTQQVISSGSTATEGSHMYKINGYYWIVPTVPATGEWVYRSTSPWGPYEQRVLVDSIPAPLAMAGSPHQGGFVETQAGDWYYVSFLDSYPAGRMPVMAPLAWDSSGWPYVVTNSTGGWGVEYDGPVTTDKTVPPLTGTDTFTFLGNEWEWNHNPDTSKFSIASGGGLVLQTATVTDDFFSARNTLTHRIIGPVSEAVFEFDISQMADGDRAGAAMFRDQSAYIGVHKSGGTATLVYVDGINLVDGTWTTASTGTVAATGPAVSGSTIYLKIRADVTPAFNSGISRHAIFSYSSDGQSWTQLGDEFSLVNTWSYFTGYRYAAFNFATSALGGQVTLKSFSMNLV
ncbi:glycosyl hydrolase family 43 protein [Pestalotiopsis sp. NC0098]|nr:glycosyl hydrolase family 43 protein [Pestalotiopsis sp. NC0098]